MTIGEVIAKHYDEYKALIRNPDTVIENSNTYEDIFQSAILTALKKYKDEEVDEKEAFNYVRKTILTEFLFCRKRKKRDLLILSDENFENMPE